MRCIGMDGLGDLSKRAVETLYVHAMLLADDAKAAFDHPEALPPGTSSMVQTLASFERLRVTTRLMHVVAWLLTRRGVFAGEIDQQTAMHPSRALGAMPVSDPTDIDLLPDDLRLMVHASIDLAERTAALERALNSSHAAGTGPANDLQDRLRGSYAA